MIPRKSREEILQEMLRGIVQDTEITMVGPGSVTRAIAGSIATVVADANQALADAIINSHLALASGFYLDLCGDDWGLQRKLPSEARVGAEDRLIRVYVESGTLAEKLPHPSNQNLGRVPSGTQLSTGTGIIYVVDQDYDFPAAAREAYVGAVSSATGISQNIGAGALRNHSLGSGVFVTNVASIGTGQDLEGDEEYRFRLSKYVTSAAGRNEISVRLAVLSVAGIKDVIKLPFHAGSGSFKMILIPIGNRLPIESLRQAREAVARVVSEGTFFQIDPPTYLPFSTSIRLIGKDGRAISATDRDLAQQAVLRYLGDLSPGQTLIVNQLRVAILNSSRNIGDLRINSVSINKRPQALLNYTLQPDEVFVPDDDLDDPIQVL